MPPEPGTKFLSLALAVIAVALSFLLMDAPSRESWEPTTVVVPKGIASAEAARILRDEGVLRHPLLFRALVQATFSAKRLQHGEYAFPEPPSVVEVWEKLFRGEATRHTVTIPEGSNLYEIAQVLEGENLADPEEFLEAASSPEVLGELNIPGETAEGFLFPDTYKLDRSMSCRDIIGIMAREFRRRFPSEWEKRAGKEGFSLLQIVTIASIIEKETGVEEEKPLVSAVIRTRLSRRMPLQMDPTVIYGLKRFGSELTKQDLRTPSPYNSYLNRGLPPGPIANPGLSALRAALHPADTDYLYFVSRNDGTHLFSRTLAEHNRGVASYQRGEATD